MDLTTIGVKFLWAVETEKGTKPEAFTQIKKCKNISSISLDRDSIDTTPLEADTKTHAAGLYDPAGGSAWNLTFALSDEFATAWNALKDAADSAGKTGKATWGEVLIPGMTNACFFTFEPGDIPLNEIGVGEALEVEIANVINEFKGWSEKVDA